MGTEGKIITQPTGKRGINASGKAVVFDAAGEAECCTCVKCGECKYPCDMSVYYTYDGIASKHHYTLDITLKIEMFLESSDCSGTPTFIAGGVPYPFGTGNYYGGSTTNYYAPPNTNVIGTAGLMPYGKSFFFILDNSEAVRVHWLYRNCDNNTWHIIFDAEQQGWPGIEQVYNFIRRLACEIPPESAISGGIAGGSYFDVELEGDCEGTEVDITCCSGPGYYPGVNGVPPVPDPDPGYGYTFYSSARATMTITLTNNWKESCP